MENLYDSIESLCAQRGIRPGRLCNDLGLSRGLITDLKMGRKKSVNAETAQKIAAYFGISVGQLLGQEEGDILDLAANCGVIQKSGAWYAYNDAKIGQGRENAKQYLRENPAVCSEVEMKVRDYYGLPVSAEAAGR